MSNYDDSKHPRDPEKTGRYAAVIKPAPASGVVNNLRPNAVLGEAPDWFGGGSTVGVQVIESPVSDRERNYHLTFDEPRGGFVFVSPSQFGIEDPERESDDEFDVDRLTVSRQTGEVPGVLFTRFDAAVRDIGFTELLEDVSGEELTAIESEIRQELRAVIGRGTDAIFGSELDRWADVQVLYTKIFPADGSPATIDPDGRTSVTTSNLMVDLEDDDGYLKVRGGVGDRIIFSVLERHGIDVG